MYSGDIVYGSLAFTEKGAHPLAKLKQKGTRADMQADTRTQWQVSDHTEGGNNTTNRLPFRQLG
jgi:hypothetical protein